MYKLKDQVGKFMLIGFMIMSQIVIGQTEKHDLDISAIKSMAGCFDVEFKYTETFSPEVDYEKAYDYTSGALEMAYIIEDSPTKIALQHLLVIGDSMVIKHWRQDWTYENPNVYRFHKDTEWKYEPLDSNEVVGKWTQEVFQVDDSPRYTGTATWTHVDGISAWFHKADSPLPRREYSKRSDYNVMKRGNRVQIMDYGWLHEQDNDKIIRSDTADVLLAQEKGYNTYKRVDDAKCKPAKDWWEANHQRWDVVRDIWSDVYAGHKTIKLKPKVEGRKLYEYLFFSKDYESEKDIRALIQKFVSNEEMD